MTGLVRSDREDRQVDWPEDLSDFGEDLAVGSVSRVEDLLPFRSLDHEAAPKASVLLNRATLGPVAHRHESYLKLLPVYHHLLCLSPVELLYPAIFGEDVLGIEAGEEDGGKSILKRVEGMLVQVVVVVMADEYCVDGGKLGDVAGWLAVSAGANALEGRGALREDRIYHDVGLAADCEHCSRVANPGVCDLVFGGGEDGPLDGQ